MSKNIFLTGFPGFIASRLIPELILQRPDSNVFLLVQKKFLENAKKQIQKLEESFSFLKNKLIIIEGDLTFPEVIVNKNQIDSASITEVFNLAAVYDLRVNKELAYEINVKGTEHIVKLSLSFKNLEKFHHISTCYVAGWYRGEFSEDDFDKSQDFKNFYEETKFLSEKIIRENKDKIPFIIYRPSIVIGDSKTGETNKFDGPYPIIFLINKLPKVSLMTQIGSGVNPANLVPVDYVVKGIAALSNLNSIYQTYHLCDPEPFSQIKLIEIFGKKLGKKLIPVKVKASFIRSLMKYRFITKITGLYPELIDYFDHDLIFKCEKTIKALEKFNIHPPRLIDYIDNVINYAIKHQKEISRKGLW